MLGDAEAEHAVPVAGGGGARLHHHPLRVQVEGPPLLQQQQHQQQRPHRHQHPAGAHPLTQLLQGGKEELEEYRVQLT